MPEPQKQWVVKPSAPESFLMQFREYPQAALQLAWQRGLHTKEQLNEFFHPDYNDHIHDPFLYKDMDKAIARLTEAVARKERIVVFGDYDADGTCGAVILKTLIADLGGDVFSYLPDRFEEGHGLTDISIAEIKRLGAGLVITVDCGITEISEVKELNGVGIDTIILDHHLPQDTLPDAVAVVDSKRKDDAYPFDWLCGTGVAFKFVQAAVIASARGEFDVQLPSGYEKQFLDLVAIATVADTVPLLGENRTLLVFGLPHIARTTRLGLQALLLKAGLSGQENIDVEAVAFSISPRINAASRLDHANIAFSLLTTKDNEEAERLAKDLEAKNTERQKMVANITKQAEERIAAMDEVPSAIVLSDPDWSLGVIGIVANKILNKWNRPVFLFQERGDIVRGSARCPAGFDLVEAMNACGAELFIEFGGHSRAAGAALRFDVFPEFKKRFARYAKERFLPAQTAEHIDLMLNAKDISWETWDWINRMAPFGEANAPPIFMVEDLEVVELREVGKKADHLQLKLFARDGGRLIKAILFKAERLANVRLGSKLHAVIELIADRWQGRRDLKLKIRDWRVLQPEYAEEIPVWEAANDIRDDQI